MTSEAERTGVLVVRIWTEGASGPLRARITSTLDADGGPQESRAAASAEQVLTAVRDWLDTFVSE